jgi:hypothetical protein
VPSGVVDHIDEVIMAAVSGCVGTCDSLPRTVSPTARPRLTIAAQATSDCSLIGTTGNALVAAKCGRLLLTSRCRDSEGCWSWAGMNQPTT